MWKWILTLTASLFARRPSGPPTIDVRALPSASVQWSGAQQYWTGSKFPGGLGLGVDPLVDYWSLRELSARLFRTNLYARGIVRRFVTNVINTGLHLECVPEEQLLGFEPDALADWSELIENRWHMWERRPRLCDHREQRTFGALQALAYAEALIAGDVLVTLQQDPRTGLPRVRLISGAAVQTPIETQGQRGNRIVHGVELDAQDRHVGYWVRQLDGTSRRVPAWGEKSGRRIAWLVYATDRRLDDVRGEPILSLIAQSLTEIDRYRDATQRKAVINSMIAAFVRKTADKPGTLPFSGGATRRDAIVETDSKGEQRAWKSAEMIPGLIMEELQQGEEPVAFDARGTDEKFADFEAAIVQGIAWGLEVPPEIVRLSFNNNYSASQAAINEFKMFLNRVRAVWGDEFCAPVYEEWLVSEALLGKWAAPGLLDAWRDASQYDVYAAWVASEWAGQIKPAVDLSKLVRGYSEMVAEGFVTRDRASRELTGTKFSKNAKRLRLENEQLARALEPVQATAAPAATTGATDAPDDAEDREAA